MKHWRKQRSRATPAARGVRLGLEALEDRSVPAVTVTGTIWQDAGAIGQREGGEPGLLGAVVELFGSTDATVGNADDVSLGLAITSADGSYTISAADATNYYAQVRIPAGYAFTTQNTGPDATDSDVDALGTSALFAVSPGGSSALDAGVTGAAPSIQAIIYGTAIREWADFLARDGAGNVYVSGNIGNGPVDFDAGPGTSLLPGTGGAFLAKYTVEGSLAWLRNLPTSPLNMTADPAGNVYLVGEFSGTANFDLGTGSVSVTATGLKDAFVCKIDADGNSVWARMVDGSTSAFGRYIGVDGSGNVLVGGFFLGTGQFNAGTGTASATSSAIDIYVWKLDSAGNTIWARTAGGSSFDACAGIGVDAAGNVYASGTLIGNSTVGIGTSSAVDFTGDFATFVWKLNPTGDTVWARFSDVDDCTDLATDAAGNTYVTGYTTTTSTFDAGTGQASVVSAGKEDVYVWKLDTDGNTLWAHGAGGTDDDAPAAIALDASGAAYVTGYYYGTAAFDTVRAGFSLTSSGGLGAYVWKLDAAGNTLWARSIDGTEDVEGYDVAPDGTGGAFLVGYFSGTTDFDPTAGNSPVTVVGRDDGFFVRIDSPTATVGGTVYRDTNGDGQQQQAELAFPGAVVELMGSSDTTAGNADDVSLGTVVVGADGNYSFEVPVSYRYYVQVRIPAGYSFTTKNADADGTFSDVDAMGVSDVFSVTPGASFDVDAGVVGSAESVLALLPGGPQFEEVTSLARDAAGNLYIAGDFIGTVDFDLGVGVATLTTNGNTSETFVAKYTPAGALVWLRRAAATSTILPAGIAIDAHGNVVLTGTYSGTGEFTAGTTSATLTSAGRDVFVWKLDSSGNSLWVRRGGGTGIDSGESLAVDATGNVYVAGGFYSTASFDAGTGTASLTSTGASDAYVWKLDPAGNTLWARRGGGSSGDYGLKVALDAASNAYLAGNFKNMATFGGTTLTSRGDQDAYIWKLDASGNTLWARQAGGDGSDAAWGLAVDPAGNAYVTGPLTGTETFDAGTGAASLTSAGNNDTYVWKLDTSGNTVWAVRAGGVESDYPGAITLDPAGNPYVTGAFAGSVAFGSVNLTSLGTYDLYVWKLNTDGSTAWARALAGNGDNDFPYAIVADAAGNAYVAGFYAGTVDFDPGEGTFQRTEVGNNDGFVVQVKAPITTANYGGEQTNQTLTDKQTLAPFATLSIGQNETFTVHVAIVDGVRLGDFTPASVAGWQRVLNIGNIRYARTFTGSTAGADAQAAVRALVFDPNENLVAVGQTTTTSFVVRSYHAGGVVKLAGAIFARVTSANDAPTDITLSASTARENAPAGTLVGLVSGNDPDVTPGLRFALINNAGGRFRLIGNRIEVAQQTPLDFEQGASHVIRVRVTDASGASFEKDITITLINETITALRKQYSSATAGATFSVNAANGLLNGATSTGGRALQAQVVTSPNVGRLTLRTDGSFSLVPPSRFRGTIVFSFRIWDGMEFSAPQQCIIVYG